MLKPLPEKPENNSCVIAAVAVALERVMFPVGRSAALSEDALTVSKAAGTLLLLIVAVAKTN